MLNINFSFFTVLSTSIDPPVVLTVVLTFNGLLSSANKEYDGVILSIKSIFNVANTLSLVSAYKVRTICFKNGFIHVIVNLLFSTSCKIESILSSSRVSSLK